MIDMSHVKQPSFGISPRPANSWYQRGVSLIEVLVAIVVLTVGLLGLAGLQAAGMKVGLSSHYRAQAAQLAYDMADRMRANTESARGGKFTRALSAADETDTNKELAEINNWMARVRMLPGGQGGVSFNGALATVTIQWDDSRGTVNDATQRAAEQTRQFQLTAQIWNNN